MKILVDITHASIKVQELKIARWMLLEDIQAKNLNLGIKLDPQMVKTNVDLDSQTSQNVKQLLKEYKDIFAWTYKDLKGIPPHIVQYQIELNNIPQAHQVRYKMNPNYVTMVKHDLDKLFDAKFIAQIEEANWFFPIVIILKKN